MRAERSFSGNPAPKTETDQPENVIRATLPATETGVRRGLHSIKSSLGPTQYTSDEISSLELVLAEVLNNIVEHAYAGKKPGEIELGLFVTKVGMFVSIVDDGCEMPGGTPPMGHRVSENTPISELPEGGFGWFLIRELAEDLEYARVGDQNRLDFLMKIGTGRSAL